MKIEVYNKVSIIEQQSTNKGDPFKVEVMISLESPYINLHNFTSKSIKPYQERGSQKVTIQNINSQLLSPPTPPLPPPPSQALTNAALSLNNLSLCFACGKVLHSRVLTNPAMSAPYSI